MWNLRIEELQDGLRCTVAAGARPITFEQLFHELEKSDEFAGWYSDALAGTRFEAFFWEHPALTLRKMNDEAEFVLIESTQLAGLRADPEPFRDKFDQARGAYVITFDNLGGDARMVVPTPVGPSDAYPHLAAFLRNAPGAQVRSLWKLTAQALRETLSDSPRWLSTAGLGVSWLHLRIDTRPKYYRYGPYRTPE